MSEIRANTISDAAGTGPVTLTKQSAAKAWMNLNGVGTIALNDSFNISSVTDNAVGDYTPFFSSSFTNANYSVATSVLGGTPVYSFGQNGGSTLVGSCRMELGYTTTSPSYANSDQVCHAIFHGDLA